MMTPEELARECLDSPGDGMPVWVSPKQFQTIAAAVARVIRESAKEVMAEYEHERVWESSSAYTDVVMRLQAIYGLTPTANSQ